MATKKSVNRASYPMKKSNGKPNVYQQITQNRLHNLVNYESDTGSFFWKKRNAEDFISCSINVESRAKAWNTRYSGKKCGYKYQGYTYMKLDGRCYLAHRLAWLYVYGYIPKDCMDHINHERDDNRICNLRIVSRGENSKNKSLNKNNISGFNGVTRRKDCNRWEANIRSEGKRIYLGSFENKSDAIQARTNANIKYGFHDNHGSKKVLEA